MTSRTRKSAGEESLAWHIKASGLAGWEREVAFHPTRRWRFDFAHREKRIAVEVEGVLRGRPGRHQRVDGMTADCEKYAEALCLGWAVLRVVPAQVRSGDALRWLLRLLESRNGSAVTASSDI